jgi:hypothetical protein
LHIVNDLEHVAVVVTRDAVGLVKWDGLTKSQEQERLVSTIPCMPVMVACMLVMVACMLVMVACMLVMVACMGDDECIKL